MRMKEGKKLTGLQEIRTAYNGLETLYQTYLPKVDPILVHDLLVRENVFSGRNGKI